MELSQNYPNLIPDTEYEYVTYIDDVGTDVMLSENSKFSKLKFKTGKGGLYFNSSNISSSGTNYFHIDKEYANIISINYDNIYNNVLEDIRKNGNDWVLGGDGNINSNTDIISSNYRFNSRILPCNYRTRT